MPPRRTHDAVAGQLHRLSQASCRLLLHASKDCRLPLNNIAADPVPIGTQTRLAQLPLRLSTIIVSSSKGGEGLRNVSTRASRASPALSGTSTGTVEANAANRSEPSSCPAASLDSVSPSVYKTSRSPGLSCMAVCVYGVPAMIPHYLPYGKRLRETSFSLEEIGLGKGAGWNS